MSEENRHHFITNKYIRRPGMEEEERYYYALQYNDIETLRRLLADGADPDHVFIGLTETGIRPNKWSALILCCEKGFEECARELLQAGADPDICDRWNWTPLFHAIQREWHRLVELLLTYKCDVNVRDRRGWAPLHCCGECPDVEYGTSCMSLLLEHGADLTMGDSLARTPLWLSVNEDGHVERTRMILKHGACGLDDPDAREKRTPLQAAIMHASRDRMQYVHLLLEAGCDVNAQDARKHTSLMNVIWKTWADGEHMAEEDLEICKLILQRGYAVDSRQETPNWLEYGGPVISMATERGVYPLVQMLLEHGTDPDVTDSQDTGCVLLATDRNRLSILALLITYGANVDLEGQLKVNACKQTLSPLCCAIQSDYHDAAMILVMAGCDMKKVSGLLTNENMSGEFMTDWAWLRDIVMTPRSLLHLSRDRIRGLLGRRLRHRVKELVLPPYLMKVIRMEDITAPWLQE